MSNLPPEIVGIAEEHASALFSMISRVYEAGKIAGRAEAEAELKDKLSSVLNVFGTPRETAPSIPASPPDHSTTAVGEPKKEGRGWTQPRAPRGSVRPAIIEALRLSRVGLNPKQILEKLHEAGHTLVKDETIRSTLHKMATDGITQQTKDGWILKTEKSNPASEFADDEFEDDSWGEPLNRKGPDAFA